MDKSKDRNDKMKKFFKSLSGYLKTKIEYERITGFNAIDNNIYTKIDFGKEEYDLHSIYFKEFSSIKKTNLKKEQFGCLYSHFIVLSKFLESNRKWTFVCEDDLSDRFIEYNKFVFYLNQVISNLNYYDIISISCAGSFKNITKLLEKNNKTVLYKYQFNIFYGTGCYLITRKGAVNLLQKFTNYFDNNFDGQLKLRNLENKSCVADILLYENCRSLFLLPSLFLLDSQLDSTITKNAPNDERINQIFLNKWRNLNRENLEIKEIYNVKKEINLKKTLLIKASKNH